MRRFPILGLFALTPLFVCLVVGGISSTGCDSSDDSQARVPAPAPDGAAPPVTKTVGAQGGDVTSNGLTLRVPAGALDHDVAISVTPLADPAPQGYVAKSPLYRFEPSGLTFRVPAEIEIPVQGSTSNLSVIWSTETGGFTALATTATPTTVRAAVNHFSVGFAGLLDPGAAVCASVAVSQAPPAANLVIMFDKSASMAQPKEERWDPVTAAMKSFFTDTASAGKKASLHFFPQGSTSDAACAYAYDKPTVAMTALPTTTFGNALSAVTPQGGTPTQPALRGAIAYAKTVAASSPSTKTVVLLVTDGEPDTTCANNDIEHVAAEARAGFASGVPTYVIGVGPSLDKLDTIAAAGGTNKAIVVDVSDPNKTSDRMLTALNQVGAGTVSCDFAMPSPPQGQTLDPNTVRVTQKVGTVDVLLAFSADCADANGWHYDDATAPTRVLLCPNACTAFKSNRDMKFEIAFGCK